MITYVLFLDLRLLMPNALRVPQLSNIFVVINVPVRIESRVDTNIEVSPLENYIKTE